MFKIFSFLPFFEADGTEAGKTAEEIAAEQAAKDAAASKIEADEPDEYTKLLNDVNASREAILSEGQEIVKPDEATKTPEEIAAENVSKIAEQQTTIDDEFINNVDKAAEYFGFSKLDKNKVIESLKSFKGRKLDNDVLKSHVHSQVTLQEYKEKGSKNPDNPSADDIFNENKPDLEIGNKVSSKYSDKVLEVKGLQEEEVQSINSAKQAALFNLLKPQFKDLKPDDLADEDSVNDFIATININKPLLAGDFVSAYRKANAQLIRETNEYVDRAKNWRVHMKQDAEAQIEKFGNYLKSKGLKPEQLETTIDQGFVINKILQDQTGKIKTDIVKNYKDDAGIFILDNDKFYQALVDHFDPRITELVKKIGANNSFEKRIIKEPNPSQSSSTVKGSILKPEDWAKKGEIPDDATDFEAMQQALEQNRKAIKEL